MAAILQTCIRNQDGCFLVHQMAENKVAPLSMTQLVAEIKMTSAQHNWWQKSR
jgi:hypothetical protein